MKLSKERRIYVAVLGVGLLALVVDRAMFSPTGALAAAESYTVNPPSGMGAAGTGSGEKLAATEAPKIPELAAVEPVHGLAQRLRTSVPKWEEQIGDAFKPSEAWLPPVKIEDPSAPPKSQAEAFCRAHVLKGVTGPRSTVSGAWVSGKFLKVGDSLDGWVLLEVTNESALFERTTSGSEDRERAELRLGTSRVSGVSRRGQDELQGPPPPDSK